MLLNMANGYKAKSERLREERNHYRQSRTDFDARLAEVERDRDRLRETLAKTRGLLMAGRSATGEAALREAVDSCVEIARAALNPARCPTCGRGREETFAVAGLGLAGTTPKVSASRCPDPFHNPERGE